MNGRLLMMLALLITIATGVSAVTIYPVNYATGSTGVTEDWKTMTFLPNQTIVYNTTYHTYMTSSSGSPGNVRSYVRMNYNDSSSYTTDIVIGASSPIVVSNPYPFKAVDSITWYVYKTSSSSIEVGITVDNFYGDPAVSLFSVYVNNVVTGLPINSYCVSGITSGLSNETNCTISGSSVTSLMSESGSGNNSKTRLENYQDLVSDGFSGSFNTTKRFNNGTHTFIIVPWFDLATSCSVSNLKTYDYYTTVNATRVVMVTDELSEACLVTAMSNRTNEIDYFYNTIRLIKSSYGSLPVWVSGIDFSNNASPSVTLISSDTASDGTNRLAQCMYVASINDDVTSSNQSKYLSLANNLTQDHVTYETVTGSFSSAYGTISRLPMSGRNCANAGVGNAAGTTGCTVDYYVGYFKDAIKNMLMAYARTGNATYATIAQDYVKAHLSVSLQADTDGDGFGVAPLNFNWNTTGNLRHSGGPSVNNYFYNNSPYSSLQNMSWDDSDAPRDRVCDTLRGYNITNGGLDGAWVNLSAYCIAKANTNTYTATTSCLQFYYNGTCGVALAGGFYQNGLGAMDHTFHNTTLLPYKLDEALGHYSWTGKTFDSTACGNGLTYRGVRTTLMLGKAIGLDDDVYVSSGTNICEQGNSTNMTNGGLSVTINNPYNASQTTQNSVLLSVTVYNNNVSTTNSPGSLPNVLYNSTFSTTPASDGWTLNSWAHTSLGGGVINNTADNGGAGFMQNLSLSQMTNGYLISLNMSLTNFTNAKIFFGTNSGSQDGDRILLERNGAGGSLVNIKHDGGGYSSFTVNANQYVIINISVNLTSGNLTVATSGNSWTEALANNHLTVNGSYIAFVPGQNMSEYGGWNISTINVTNTGTPYNISTTPSALMNVTFYNHSNSAIIGTSVNNANGSAATTTWSGLYSGNHTWFVNVKSATEDRNFTNTFFTVVGAQSFGPFCTTTGNITVANLSNGEYDLTTYNISNGTYYNQTSTTTLNINTTQSYWANLTVNTWQAIIRLSAYRLFLNTSILNFIATNNQISNTTTVNDLFIKANNGTNTLQVAVPGNITKNVTCTITSPLSTGYCNATGIYDSILTIYAVSNGAAVINYTINMTNLSLQATPVVAQNTTNYQLQVPLLQGYNYFSEFISDIYASANATINVNEQQEYYNFSVYVSRSLDLEFYDEETTRIINYSTVTFEMISDVQSENRTTNNGTLHLDLLTPANYTVRYSSPGYIERFYQLSITPTSNQNINLTLLNSTSGTNVTVTVVDNFGNPLEGAIVKVQKYNVITNSDEINQILTTNFEGKGIASVLLNSEYYRFLVEYEGRTVLYTARTYVYGTTITLQVNLQNEAFDDVFTINGITGTITFNNNTGMATFTYNDQTNTGSACLYAYQYNSRNQTLTNSTCSASSSGSISVAVNPSTGRTYQFRGYMTVETKNILVTSLEYAYKAIAPTPRGFSLLITAILMIICVFIMRYHLGLGIISGSSIPLIISITGLNTLGIGAATAVLIVGVIVAYIIEVRR